MVKTKCPSPPNSSGTKTKTKTKTQNQLRIDFCNKRIMVSQDTSVDTIRCHANLCHTSFIHSSVSIKTFI